MNRPPPASPSPADRPERSYAIGRHSVTVERLDAGLPIVAAPIGNLGDITLRALAALAGADLIACLPRRQIYQRALALEKATNGEAEQSNAAPR